MAKLPTLEEMAQNVAEKALDEYEYNGKTLREWVEIISAIPVTAIPATDNNVGTKLSTNLAEVGTDCISRQAVIDEIRKCRFVVDAIEKIRGLPSAEPVLTCDGCRHVGTYDTEFPCNGCIRREKDYYETDR